MIYAYSLICKNKYSINYSKTIYFLFKIASFLKGKSAKIGLGLLGTEQNAIFFTNLIW